MRPAEDLALAQRWFTIGPKEEMIIGVDHLSTRMHGSLREIVDGWTKNLWTAAPDAMPGGRAGRVLLAPPPLLLAQLVKMLVAMIAEATRGKASDAERKIVANIFRRVQELTEERNDTIHRMWFIGWGSAEDSDFATTSSWKLKATKEGTEFRPKVARAADFDALSDRASGRARFHVGNYSTEHSRSDHRSDSRTALPTRRSGAFRGLQAR